MYLRLLLFCWFLFANAADNLTTWWCLTTSVPGFEVYEANPFAAWSFEMLGLVPALILETIITTLVAVWLVWGLSLNRWCATPFFRHVALPITILMCVLSTYATINNLWVMKEIGFWN